MNFNIKKCAAMAALDRIKQKYPGAISYVEEIANATDFTDMWDHSMVYAPLPVAHAAMEKSYKREISRTDALDASVIAAAASWRLDKSIYDFSAELTKELFEVSCRKILNIDISSIHLPKKVIYIRPGIKMPGNIDGFFVYRNENHIEYPDRNIIEIRFTPITKNGLPLCTPFLPYIPGEEKTIEQCICNGSRRPKAIDYKRLEEMLLQDVSIMDKFESMDKDAFEEYGNTMGPFTAFLATMLVYLSADNADIQTDPDWKSKQTSKIHDIPREITVFNVGANIACRLKQLNRFEAKEFIHPGSHSSDIRIRRAYWQSYRYGPGRKLIRLKWTHTALVDAAGQEIADPKF